MTAPLFCIVGAGYTGRRLARALAAAGHETLITRRSPPVESGDGGAIRSIALDLDRRPVSRVLPGGKPLSIAYLVPPAGREPDPRLAGFLASLARAPERVVLASTSGVYGDCGGALVDETCPARPLSERARRRLGQETLLTQWTAQRAVRCVILRIAGIYGPGRLPTGRLIAAEPFITEADAYPGNRIHVDDLVRVLLAALTRPDAGGVYNVSDGNHASGTDFGRRLAALAGLPMPAEISRREAERRFSPRRYSFLSESRRLVSRRIREELGVQLEYTDLDAGIRASLERSG